MSAAARAVGFSREGRVGWCRNVGEREQARKVQLERVEEGKGKKVRLGQHAGGHGARTRADEGEEETDASKDEWNPEPPTTTAAAAHAATAPGRTGRCDVSRPLPARLRVLAPVGSGGTQRRSLRFLQFYTHGGPNTRPSRIHVRCSPVLPAIPPTVTQFVWREFTCIHSFTCDRHASLQIWAGTQKSETSTHSRPFPSVGRMNPAKWGRTGLDPGGWDWTMDE